MANKNKTQPVEPEFSFTISVDKIAAAGMQVTLQANDKQRALLAERFDLLELTHFSALFDLHSGRADMAVSVTGAIKADLVQPCVATLEPLPQHVEEQVDVLFMPEAMLEGDGSGPPTIELNQQEIEPLINGVIDLGELASQYLGAALDPYPRKEGLGPIEAEYGTEIKTTNPFAKLAELVKKPEK
jgi:uncharacterized metal-binding protein YceD (DUF177 family)